MCVKLNLYMNFYLNYFLTGGFPIYANNHRQGTKIYNKGLRIYLILVSGRCRNSRKVFETCFPGYNRSGIF